MANKSNTEFVTELMEFSNYGALSQMFIMEAIMRYVKEVKAAKKEDWSLGIVSFEAWQGVSNEISDKLRKRFEQEIKNR